MADKLAKNILNKSTSKKGMDVMEALSLPQRILMKKAAEMAGVEPGQTSEESAFNIVDKIANKAGLPEDSNFANALKATAVASLETFADPLGPLGKLTKFNKMRMAARKGKEVAKGVLNTVKKAKPSPKTLQMAERGTGKHVAKEGIRQTKAAAESVAHRKAQNLPTAIVDQKIDPSQALANRPTMQIGPDKGAAERLGKRFRGEE